MKVQMIPVAQIKANPAALRGVNRDSVEFISLRDSIASKGLLYPITVREKSDDNGVHFELIDGLQRFTAINDLGHTEIPASICSFDDSEVLQAQIIANASRIETKHVEYTKGMLRLLAMNPTWTYSELAATLCRPLSWVSDHFNLMKLCKEAQAMVDEGKITLLNAYALAKLKDQSEQQNYLTDAQVETAEVFLPKINARVKEINAAARQGRAPGEVQFVAMPHMRKPVEVKDSASNPSVLIDQAKSNNCSTVEQTVAFVLNWVLHLDPASVSEAKAKFDADRAAIQAKKERAAAERTAKKQAEAEKNTDNSLNASLGLK